MCCGTWPEKGVEWMGGPVCNGVRHTSGDVFVDIGAHVGLAAIAFAKRFPKSRVFAFEPIPATFEDLEWNIKANNLSHIITPQVSPSAGLTLASC